MYIAGYYDLPLFLLLCDLETEEREKETLEKTEERQTE